VCPKWAEYQWGKDPLEQLMVGFDSWRAFGAGNRADRNLATKPTIGGRAIRQAVTCVKLEQASKAVMWTPTRRKIGEGSTYGEEPGAGTRHDDNHRAPVRSAGVVSTACWKGNQRQWGRPGVVAELRSANVAGRAADHLGVGKGQRYRRGRVTPAEGRALASGVFVKEERTGD
jgi:hypothetical protein